jgi:hypothetical protein
MVTYKKYIWLLASFLIACVNANTGRENAQTYVDGFAPANLQYSETTVTFYEGLAATAQVPSVSVRKGLTRCVSSPALPSGLTLNAETCAISGTPVAAQAEVKYTITGSNDFGSTSTEIGIRIYIPPPSNLIYSGSPFTFFELHICRHDYSISHGYSNHLHSLANFAHRAVVKQYNLRHHGHSNDIPEPGGLYHHGQQRFGQHHNDDQYSCRRMLSARLPSRQYERNDIFYGHRRYLCGRQFSIQKVQPGTGMEFER